jgi:hypothetical protein
MARLLALAVVVLIAVVSAEEEVDETIIRSPSITAPAFFRPALSSLLSHIPILGNIIFVAFFIFGSYNFYL